jgi:thermolysin
MAWVCAFAVLAGWLLPSDARAQGHATALSATRAAPSELRALDLELDRMVRSRDLRLRETQQDALVPSRQHERLEQFHRGVRIVGGDVTRQTAPDGTVSVFGMLHSNVDIKAEPTLQPEAARTVIGQAVNGQSTGASPELVVLPQSDGYHLAYRGQVITGIDVVNVFVDASSGALLQQFSDFQTDGVVGKGIGTYGDQKKVSAKPLGGTFVADDGLRPAAITTYDMKGNFARTVAILNRTASVAPSDIASDSDNDWSDATVVDAHVYAGWYYDYLFKRFGRHGLDDREQRIAVLTHPVRLADINTASSEVVGLYYLNAFYCATCGPDGRGAVTFGEGAPRGYFGSIEIKNFAAGLDVVAHELTHGVTANTARLNGFPFSEAGALNEAFSDMFGVSAAFFHEPVGTAPLTASYIEGRDLTVPAGLIGRSLANPLQNGDPDHYSQRFIGADPHYNSTIASHAFYLAIEGGTNRTSRLPVQGVGAANREQIEKSFFRALTVLLPSSSTFALTRAATSQAARDLYGAGSAAERAITQAWDAVGVQPRTTPAAVVMPNPAPGSNALCGTFRPSWSLGITLSAGDANLRITSWRGDYFDASGRQLTPDLGDGANFAQFFGSCGPRSDRIVAQSDACSTLCVNLEGATSGSTQFIFNAVDDAERTMTFTTPRARLLPPQ